MQELYHGSTVFLSEIEVDGHTVVVGIASCPPVAPGDGQVVTGQFKTHQVPNLVRVRLENGTTFTGTDTHPAWLPDVEEWVRLGDLQAGDRLETLVGPIAVLSVELLPTVSDVYNIETHGHHVYRITDDGVLVHNNGTCGGENRFRDIIDVLVGTSKPSQNALLQLPSAPAKIASRLSKLKEAAATLEYRLTKYKSHGQPVFSNGKTFITPDVDGHNVSDGWKMATTIPDLGSKTTRMGTYGPDLKRIGD